MACECVLCKRPKLRNATKTKDLPFACYDEQSLSCINATAAYRRGLADGVKMAKLKAFPDSLTFSSINWTYVDAALEAAKKTEVCDG